MTYNVYHSTEQSLIRTIERQISKFEHLTFWKKWIQVRLLQAVIYLLTAA